MVDPRELDRCVEGAAAAHQRLLGHLDRLIEGGADEAATVARPSLLPGWSVGHVLTHLARNADSHRRMFEAAERGEVGDQYPGGLEQRTHEIDAGHDRRLSQQRDDLRRAIWALEAAWSSCTEEAWRGSGRSGGAAVPIAELPFRRWREVEVHHADLDLGVSFEDWTPEYVRRDLVRQQMAWRARTPMGLSGLPARALELPPAARLAWLLGRLQVEGLPSITGP